MIALAVRQSKHSLLEDRVPAVPESDGKTQTLLLVADAGDTVFAPVIGTRSGLIVAKVIPGIAVLAVVFSDGSPLALAQVRPPELPGRPLVSRGIEARPFDRLRWFDSRAPGHWLIPR